MARYVSILRRRAALLPFVAALIGRLPISMTPLGMVLLVQQIRGSYSVAGLVAAVFALGTAVGTPLWGRLLDRSGQPQVIGPLSGVSAVLLAVLAAGAVKGAPDGALIALAAGVGLTFPPISPAMRGAWRVILADPGDRQAAYALEAVVIETVFVAGPLLLSAMLLLDSPAVPLLVTAMLLGVGGVGYAITPAARAWRPEPAQVNGVRGGSPLRSAGVVAVLATAALLSIGFGQLDVGIAATARVTLGDQGKVGLLFMAIAGGSAVGGLIYGSRSWPGVERHRLPVVLALFGGGLATTSVVLLLLARPPLGVLLPVLFFTGLWIAPAVIVKGNLVDRNAAADRLNEAQAWLTTAFTAGGALGNAIAGVLIDVAGPARAFLGATGCVLAAAAAATACQRVWRRPSGAARGELPAHATDTAPSVEAAG